MKKSLLWLVVVLLSVSMIAAFTLAGCKETEEGAAPVEEEALEEETGEGAAPAEEEALEEETEEAENPAKELEDYYAQYSGYIDDTTTVGPNGEKSTWFDEVTLSNEEINKIREGNYSLVYLAEGSSMFTNANIAGTKDACDFLNIELLATADSEYDIAKEKINVETVLALNPDIIVALPLDPVQSAETFRPALDKGVTLVFMSNVPQGYTQGEDYVGIVTDDLFGMGKAAAEILADSLNGKGKVGMIFHDAVFYVTNQRDNGFKKVIEENYPEIEIVAEEGMVFENEAEVLASAMITQNPDLNGMYATWEVPAQGAVTACRAAERPDIKIVTLDLGAITGLDMAQGGNVVGIAADLAYLLGYTKVIMGVYGILDKAAPEFVIVPAIKVTKDNLKDGWWESLHQETPKEISEELED